MQVLNVRIAFAFVLVFAVGCGQAEPVAGEAEAEVQPEKKWYTPWATGEAEVEAEVQPEKKWYTPWRKSEAEQKAKAEDEARIVAEEKARIEHEAEEKALVAAENKARLEHELVVANELLDEWLTKLGDKQSRGNGFVHHEGRTELDPWGNLLQFEYTQVNLKEFIILRSLGPDGQLDTEDDLVRKNHATNYSGMFKGLNRKGAIALFCSVCSILVIIVVIYHLHSIRRIK
jgi:hypothetical protein